MKDIPNGSQTQVPMDHNRDDESPSAADYCVACHVRAAYNMLTHSIEILRALALGKRHQCIAAGKCSNTGLPMRGNDPPQEENCECFLTREVADAVFRR
jgi:hypothetical protein